jgi:hypothetical protein
MIALEMAELELENGDRIDAENCSGSVATLAVIASTCFPEISRDSKWWKSRFPYGVTDPAVGRALPRVLQLILESPLIRRAYLPLAGTYGVLSPKATSRP